MTHPQPILTARKRKALLGRVQKARDSREVAQTRLDEAVVACAQVGIGPTEISTHVGIKNRTWVYRILRRHNVEEIYEVDSG